MIFDDYYDEIDEILSNINDYLGISPQSDEDNFYDDDENDSEYTEFRSCTAADVERLGTILERYILELNKIASVPNDEAIMKIVEGTVNKINKLNSKCEYDLLEPTQGDDIVDFLDECAKKAGISETYEKISELYRDF